MNPHRSLFPHFRGIVLSLCAFAAPLLSKADLFYTQASGTTTLDALKRAELNGTGVSALASDTANFAQPKGIAVDSANGHVYVADSVLNGGGIIRYDLAGGNRTVVVPAVANALYNDVAVAGSKIYFTQGSGDASLDALKSADLNGANIATLASGAGNFSQPGGVSVDTVNNRIYVADSVTSGGGIIQFDLAGGNRTVVVSATASALYNDVTVAGSKIYFTQGSGTATLDALKSADLNGANLATLASGSANFTQPAGLAVDTTAGYIYVADASTSGAGILRFNLLGGDRFVLINPTASALYNDVSLEGGDVLPPAPSTPDLASASDSGSSNSDNHTNDTTPTFTGTAEAGSTVTILRGGISVGTGVATGGNYSITTSALADGVHSITATATNLVGTGPASSGLSVTIDATAPSTSIGVPSTGLTRTGPVSYLVTYSDTNFASSSLTGGNITLNSTGTANASVGISGGGNTRTVTLSSITGNGTLGISIASGTATDVAGNLATAAGASTTFTVDNTAPVITSTLSASGTYDAALSTYTITASGSPVSFGASGLPNGLSVNTGNGQITGTPLQTGSFNVTLSAPDSAGNIGTATLVLSIAQKTLTVSGVTAASKTYDRTSAATLGFGAAALVGIRGGDTVSLNIGSAVGVFSDEDVGSGKTVAVSGLALSGASSGNYTLTQPTTTASITAAGLTVTGVTASNKTYDRTTAATLNLGSAALTGVIGGDTVGLDTSAASGSFTTASVGTGKPVSVIGLALTGGDAGNYSLTQPGASADITAAALAVTGVTANNKAYDGTTSATLSLGSAALSGVIGGDSVGLDTGAASGSFSTPSVGTGKTVAIAGLALTGGAAGNYSLTQPSAAADITAVVLTVTADAKIRPYGYANPTFTATITGFVNGETAGSALTGAPALGTGANAASVPGTYAISAAIGSLAATNYTFTFADGTLTVRGLDITDWEEANFTPSELLDENISGPNADPDLDGVTNLYEYAFGTDPNDIASGPDALVYAGTFAGGGSLEETGQPLTRTETTPVNNTRLLLIRRKPAFTTDLTYTVQFSHNGTAWVTSAVVPTVLAESGLYQVVSVPYPSLTSGKRTRFHRIVAEVVE